MRINNKMVSQFNMKVYNFSYQPLSMLPSIFKSDIGLNVVHGGFTIEPKPMNLVCLFRNKLDISKFIQNITENVPTIIDIDDEFRYECYYLGGSSPSNEIWNSWYKVTFPFEVVQQSKEMHVITLKDLHNQILNSGTYESPCVIEIVPTTNISQLKIGDYTVKNLVANQKFVIDGIKKKVYSNDENRFSDVEFKNNRFPFLKTGINVIDINSLENVSITIKFRNYYI